MTEYERLIDDVTWWAPESRQTHNSQLLKHLLPSFWVSDLGMLHSHYDNPSGFAKYIYIKNVIFRPHFWNTCFRFMALGHFIAEFLHWSRIWCYFSFTSLDFPVLTWIVLAELLVFNSIMLSWHIPHTVLTLCLYIL